MAKKPQPNPTPAPPKQTQPLKTSFRLERLSKYEYQAIRTTRQADGSVTEEAFGAASLPKLVVAKIFGEMLSQANEAFEAGNVQA